MELEGEFGTRETISRHPNDTLMLQCTTLSPQTAFPPLQMDLQAARTSSGSNSQETENVSSVGCVHAILDNSCSSSDQSLLNSASASPRSLEDQDNAMMENVVSSDGQSVQHWSYEEQFRQLYNLTTEPDRKGFLDKLFSFMQKKGTPITRIPIMAKQPLDMYKLFKLVVERGGLVEVIKKKAWRDIAKELNLPASITSAAFTMRSQYVKYLYPFECEEKKLSDPKELQLAIESNKRDRRHSDNVEFLPGSRDGERRDATMAAVGQQTPFTVAGNPNALQLITSPTVAIPQTSLPPYSGGFIITPTAGGTHMVHAPRLAPQLVQMGAATHPHVPIIVPTSVSGNPPSFATMIPVKPDLLCSPTALVSRERKQEDTPHDRSHDRSQDRSSPIWNSGGLPNLIQVARKPSESLIPTVVLDRNHEEAQLDSDEELPPPTKRRAVESGGSQSLPTPNAAQTLGMPFTNISIKPAMSGVSSTESSPSVLVTLELNDTIYQGVLFARPRVTSSPSR